MTHSPDAVDVAIGVLMERHGHDAEVALAVITAWPRSAGTSLADVAARIVLSARPPAVEPDVPATVRRALEFVDTHAQEDIGVTDIARAAHIGVRGLQQAFQQHRGVSPLAHLRRVRLERARVDLRAARPDHGDTVAAIAARSGFTNPGRFAILYRHRYGVPPSHTLRTEGDAADVLHREN